MEEDKRRKLRFPEYWLWRCCQWEIFSKCWEELLTCESIAVMTDDNYISHNSINNPIRDLMTGWPYLNNFGVMKIFEELMDFCYSFNDSTSAFGIFDMSFRKMFVGCCTTWIETSYPFQMKRLLGVHLWRTLHHLITGSKFFLIVSLYSGDQKEVVLYMMKFILFFCEKGHSGQPFVVQIRQMSLSEMFLYLVATICRNK